MQRTNELKKFNLLEIAKVIWKNGASTKTQASSVVPIRISPVAPRRHFGELRTPASRLIVPLARRGCCTRKGTAFCYATCSVSCASLICAVG